jgi:TetR/AcrR family tetracycline transcriptional repressor
MKHLRSDQEALSMTSSDSSGSTPPLRRTVSEDKPLRRADFIDAGRTLLATDGVDGLSMRALAKVLGVSAMAVYHHVGSKADLISLIIDDVLGQVEIPPPSAGDWESRLQQLNHNCIEAVASCPGMDVAMFSERPTEMGWRLIDGYIGILLDGGFGPREATLAFSLIHSYGVGRSGMERAVRRSEPGRSNAPSGATHLQKIWPYWQEVHTTGSRDVAMDALMAGLRVLRGADVSG